MVQTARVIPLPCAATVPVVQAPRAGRNPKKVVNLRWWRLSHEERQRIEAQRTGSGRLLAFPTGGA